MSARMTTVLIGVAAALNGCMVLGPDYTRPDVNLPAKYPESGSTGTAVAVPANWRLLYENPLLDTLVTAGLAQSTEVMLVIARIEEAEALLRETAAATLFPQVDVGALTRRSRASTRAGSLPPGAGTTRSDFQLSASTGFQLDFWGRLRRLGEAARAQYAATRHGRDVVALTLAASISQVNFNPRSLDAQILVSHHRKGEL